MLILIVLYHFVWYRSIFWPFHWLHCRQELGPWIVWICQIQFSVQSIAMQAPGKWAWFLWIFRSFEQVRWSKGCWRKQAMRCENQTLFTAGSGPQMMKNRTPRNENQVRFKFDFMFSVSVKTWQVVIFLLINWAKCTL